MTEALADDYGQDTFYKLTGGSQNNPEDIYEDILLRTKKQKSHNHSNLVQHSETYDIYNVYCSIRHF
jgi:hypothetical protein